jgi:hypothetical protein
MKFYRDKKNSFDYCNKIIKLTCIYYNGYVISFLKNGLLHNNKNTAYIRYSEYKDFYLNGKYYGGSVKFNKKLWRKYIRLQAFL